MPVALSCSRELDILDDCELGCDDEEKQVWEVSGQNGVNDVRRGGQFLDNLHYLFSTLSPRAAQQSARASGIAGETGPISTGTGGEDTAKAR